MVKKNTTTLAKFLPEKLKKILKEMPFMAVAYSGGLDSRFLCHAAIICGCNVLTLHAKGPHIGQIDNIEAAQWIYKNKLKCIEFDFDPLLLPEVRANTHERCYFCKKELFAQFFKTLEESGESERVACDGTNADDLDQYRPGLRALKEYNIRSPLAEAGLTKQDIHELARWTDMDNAGQYPRPCLLTRFAYDLEPDRKVLQALNYAETELAPLFFKHTDVPCDFRIRLLPEPILQMTVKDDELTSHAICILNKYGFNNCQIIVSQRISGFFDTDANCQK